MSLFNSAMDDPVDLTITSPAFRHGGMIPADFTCEGSDENPPLEIDGIPEETKSLALIVDDPDAPGKTFDHWIVWNIKPETTIDRNSIPGETGQNSLGENQYTGPCPPSGTHRYFFKVYALDSLLTLDRSANKEALEQAMQNHVLGQGTLVGKFKKQKAESGEQKA